MANAKTEVDLAELHQAIVDDIRAAFPGLATVEFYRGEGLEDRKTLPPPACLLDLTELEVLQDDDPGTEQTCVMAKFEAELVISFRTTQAKRSVRMLAASLVAWLRNRRWTDPTQPAFKLPTGPALVIGAYPDDFRVMGAQRDQDLPQFEIWRVEWQQRIHLGATVWTDEGTVPTQVFIGQLPEIGIGNEDEYTQVVPQ